MQLLCSLARTSHGWLTDTWTYCWPAFHRFWCQKSPDRRWRKEYKGFSTVQFSRPVVSDSLRPHGLQHARLPCPSPTPRACSSSCPSSWWCHLTISSSVVPFSRLQSFWASGSFLMSQFFASGGQSTRASSLASFLRKKSQGWSPSEWTGWISLQFKGLSRVFSNTTVQKHQFFGIQLSLWYNSHIHTWLLEKP